MKYRELSFFDRFAAVGGIILDGIGGSPRTPDTDFYLELVQNIYYTLAAIHNNLIKVTIDVNQAKTIDDAHDSLTRIQQMGMKDTLKAQHMCNWLGDLGRQMRNLPIGDWNLTDQEKAEWNKLSYQLEYREQGAAMLYADKLRELHELSYGGGDLKHLQITVKEISDLLVVQKAQFEQLAKRAKAMRDLKS